MIRHIIKLIWNKKGSNSLMILEIFLSFLVLFFVVSYVLFNLDLVSRPLGFATKDRSMIKLDRKVKLQDSLEMVNNIKNLKENLLAMDEVEGASFIQMISPFGGSTWRTGTDNNGFALTTRVMPVDYDFGEVMDVNVIEGRWFTEEDLNVTVYEPLIVNKNFMDSYYPDKSMLDSIIELSGDMKIVGVVDDIRYRGEFEEAHETVYYLRDYLENANYVCLKLKPNLNAEVEERISNLVNTTTKTSGSTIVSLEKRKKNRSRESWLMMYALLAICGFLCINVALGLFGVLWYNISKRKSEIGLRQAMGAHGSDITWQFILEMLILTGFAIGLGIFFTVQIPLLDVTEYEDVLFYKAIGLTTLIILSLVILCALFPSLQAAKITPSTALHED